jgi:F0F1-type ATP synthase assembly protein I
MSMIGIWRMSKQERNKEKRLKKSKVKGARRAQDAEKQEQVHKDIAAMKKTMEMLAERMVYSI